MSHRDRHDLPRRLRLRPRRRAQGLGRAFTRDLACTIGWATPLILAGVAVCIPFKAEVFNLGVDGQIYLGAIASTWIALALPETTGRLGLLPSFSPGRRRVRSSRSSRRS